MQCPKCESGLTRSKYLGANVRKCESCNGMLLDRDRATKLEKRVNKEVEQLTREIETTAATDVLEKIRCPACRNRMKKVRVEELDFHVDECSNCDKAWFDGGELARLQLAFEKTPQTEELNKMRERLKGMSDEERAEYEKRIANLKDLGSPMEQAMMGATKELAFRYWWYCRY